MYFDRMDIIQAHSMFYARYHEGQFSDGYRNLKRVHILRGIHFGWFHSWCNPYDLSENGRAIYNNLVAKYEASL